MREASEPLVLRCDDLGDALPVLTAGGLRLDAISPADDPTVAVLWSPAGRAVHLVADHAASEAALAVVTGSDPPLPPLVSTYVIRRATDGEQGAGRAGMRYRDLLPDRLGGRVIASHIAIPDGGPVPDYVHHHRIRFQLIYCRAGWVRVVYEDQGPPFVLNAGDCVLQPPGIRHRVLEASSGMEVVELASPAVHATFADHELSLPTDVVRPDRTFGDQRFVWHRASTATWQPSRFAGWDERDTGIGAASHGTGAVRVLRPDGSPVEVVHHGELLFWFVLDGSVELSHDGRADRLDEGDNVSIPPGMGITATARGEATQILEVAFPA